MTLFKAALSALLLFPTIGLSQTENTPPKTMEEIEAAYASEDFIAARAGLAQLASQSEDSLVQYRYGRILLDARSGPVDVLAARDVLEKAVEQEHTAAATLLARVYLSGGQAIPRDAKQASELLYLAATRGDRESQHLLGLLLRNGDGVAADPTQAANWFRAAADQQHPEAAYELARSYTAGLGVAKNPEKALLWLNAAAKGGQTQAQLQLAMAYDKGRGVPKNRNLALEWFRKAADGGQPIAQFTMGTRYLSGEGVFQDTAEAMRWFQLSSEAGFAPATHNLGTIYADPAIEPSDDKKAAALFAKAVDGGFTQSAYDLAELHMAGRTASTDRSEAVKLFVIAAEGGYEQAQHVLGTMAAANALDGLVAPHRAIPWAVASARAGNDEALAWVKAQANANIRVAQTALALFLLDAAPSKPKEAASWLKIAAQADDPVAQFHLAQLYGAGSGVEQDYILAHKWANIAASLGSTKAAESREVFALLMTSEEIAEAQTLARLHFEKATE